MELIQPTAEQIRRIQRSHTEPTTIERVSERTGEWVRILSKPNARLHAHLMACAACDPVPCALAQTIIREEGL